MARRRNLRRNRLPLGARRRAVHSRRHPAPGAGLAQGIDHLRDGENTQVSPPIASRLTWARPRLLGGPRRLSGPRRFREPGRFGALCHPLAGGHFAFGGLRGRCRRSNGPGCLFGALLNGLLSGLFYPFFSRLLLGFFCDLLLSFPLRLLWSGSNLLGG